MNKIYLPTSEQMDTTLENLSRIAGALSTKADTSSWEGIKQIVKSGNAPKLFPIGTRITVYHETYGDMVFDVVAHDYLKSSTDENAHTMTLMCHSVIETVQYDNSEAFYYAESELPAGTYNFTIASAYTAWAAGTYQFTLTKALPAGGQLAISGHADSVITNLRVVSYANRTTTTATESVVITTGNAGTSLGTLGAELNHIERVSYGSNNYKESAIRQFLNSTSTAGSVWVPQTKFDRPPSEATSLAGFMNGLDSGFAAIVGKVIVPCSANNVYESPDSSVTKGTKYNVIDKFYLASHGEILGASSDVVEDGSVLFPYYEGATNADRIKYYVKNGLASYWWLRSARKGQTNSVRIVSNDGSLNLTNRTHTITGLTFACTIV